MQEVTTCTVRFYMTVLPRNAARMVAVFPTMRPRLALLTHVLRELARAGGAHCARVGTADATADVAQGSKLASCDLPVQCFKNFPPANVSR